MKKSIIILFITVFSLLVACNNSSQVNNNQNGTTVINQGSISKDEKGDAWMGINISPLSIEGFKSVYTNSNINSVNGVLIVSIENQSPMEQCKLDMNKLNFVTEVEGITVNDTETVIHILSEKRPNEYMNIKLLNMRKVQIVL